jgi:uncharacterized protein YndB with AHSA1/START domain
MRALHQTSKGFSVSINKTVSAPMKRLRAAFTEPKQRAAWLGGARMTARRGRGGAASRFNWTEDDSRVVITFLERPNGRPTVNVTHEKLADADAAARMKTWWRERLAALPGHLEE